MVDSFDEYLEEELRAPGFAKGFGASRANTTFALTLASARLRAGLTQKELAAKAGISQAYIAKLEGGDANPTLGRMGSPLAVMGLSLVTDVAPLLPEFRVSDRSSSKSKEMVKG